MHEPRTRSMSCPLPHPEQESIGLIDINARARTRAAPERMRSQKERMRSVRMSMAPPVTPPTNYQLPTTNYQLPTTNYQLPTTNYQLPTTNPTPRRRHLKGRPRAGPRSDRPGLRTRTSALGQERSFTATQGTTEVPLAAASKRRVKEGLRNTNLRRSPTEMDPTPPFGGHYRPQPDTWRFIMEIDILGIDLAKHVFQLHGADRRGRPVHRAKVSRGLLLVAVRTLKPAMVVMEACSTRTTGHGASSRSALRFG